MSPVVFRHRGYRFQFYANEGIRGSRSIQHFTLSTRGLHWEELDEDISVEGLLAGRGDMTNRRRRMVEAAE